VAKQKPASGKKPSKSKTERPKGGKETPNVGKRSAEGSKPTSKRASRAVKKTVVAAKKGEARSSASRKAAAKPSASKAPVSKEPSNKATVEKTSPKVREVGTKAKESVAAKVKTTGKAKGKTPARSEAGAKTAAVRARSPQRAADPGVEEKTKAVRPAPPRAGPNGRVGGVLQAARSVASRANKVVEVGKERRSHLTAEELAEFRQILLSKRRELVEDMVNLEDEARRTNNEGGESSSVMPIHMADIGSDTWEQEFTLNLIEKERTIVREIDEALERIEKKTFGTCLATGKPIAKARLRVKPWAKYCIEYARKRELGLI